MERLTHEADFGLEDWEETLFLVKSDPNGAYNILDIAKYQGEPEFDEILKNVALRLAAYEDTGLEPEEINALCEMDRRAKMAEMLRLEESAGVSIDRLAELAQADRDGRCVVLPAGGFSDQDGENALKSAMNTCYYHNNPVTRFIADAVAEKLVRTESALKEREKE